MPPAVRVSLLTRSSVHEKLGPVDGYWAASLTAQGPPSPASMVTTSSRRAGRVTNKTKLLIYRGNDKVDLGAAEVIVWENDHSAAADEPKSAHGLGAKGVENAELLVSRPCSTTLHRQSRALETGQGRQNGRQRGRGRWAGAAEGRAGSACLTPRRASVFRPLSIVFTSLLRPFFPSSSAIFARLSMHGLACRPCSLGWSCMHTRGTSEVDESLNCPKKQSWRG